MKYPSSSQLVSCLSILLLTAGCQPNDPVGPSAITCPVPAEIYAYRATHTETTATYPCVFGKINTTTGTSTSMASFAGNVQFRQAAFHITENNYYTFKFNDTTRTLLSISMSGTVTPLSNAAVGSRFDGLIYNRFNSKLYCFRTSAGVSHIAEITVSGTTYTTTDVATTLHPQMYDNATVDPATGAIYYQTKPASATTYNIEKYIPGGSVTTICTAMPVDVSGLRYNTNDNLLYAIRPGMTAYEFVKINSSGTITTLSTPVGYVDTKFYSACIDPCTDHYIFSCKSLNTATGHLYHISTTGAVMQHDSAATMYQGLSVKY